MQLHDYIQVFPNSLDYRFCLNLVNNKKYKYTIAKIGGGREEGYKNSNVRNCLYTRLTSSDDAIVFTAIGKIVEQYIKNIQDKVGHLIFNENEIIDDSGYNLLKYDKGGFYKSHFDDNKKRTRRVSISLLLNDDYDGGEFQFFGDYKIPLKAHSAIVFPSNFCYPHEVLPVKSGTRYSIVTWIF